VKKQSKPPSRVSKKTKRKPDVRRREPSSPKAVEYEVERIAGHSCNARGAVDNYLVKFVGYDELEKVAARNMTGCGHLLEEYHGGKNFKNKALL
jgi:hypothetical protein